jgi:valyl-tRNA synthetase
MSVAKIPDNLADLPNRFDYTEAESRLYAFWERGGYFHSVPDANREPYTIVIPPPNVTGALHLGHALNNALQDVLIRYKRMAGYNALWMPGTDHAGIATQAVVEKRLLEEENKTRHDLGRERLVERIWEWKAAYENRILSQLKQMGCSCDWERTRFTLDDVCARAVRQTFFDLFQRKLIYRGKRLVNWDTYLQTAVSDDEVFHDTVQGHFWHFKYPVIDPQPGEPAHVTLATTRPETMLGDTAVAVHPHPAEELDRAEAELAAKLRSAPAREKDSIQEQIDNVRQRRESMLPLLEKLRDMALDGRQVMLPLMERPIPLVADQWAKPELGSGCVKITPAHDPNDYEVGVRRELPMVNILNPDGTLNKNAGRYQGQTIEEARRNVVADLEARGLLGEIEDREIDLAHSDRSKTPIEPYLADQWFVKMADLAQSAIDAVLDGRVRIVPDRYAKGYLDWLGEKRDWPVGRQLWWGHQIPIWSKPCNRVEQHEQFLAELKRDPDIAAGRVPYQVAVNDEYDPSDEGAVYAVLHVCINEGQGELEARFEQLGYRREADVLDTWFSSALWPHSTLGWPERTPELEYYYPTSVLITSRDIITLWVARMVLTGLNNMGDIPFDEVFIHPKILDGYGETMSKSKGNGVDPVDVIEKFGADALRFALTHMTTETQDVRMPVQFECPHCETLIEQTKKNRELPRIQCTKCSGEFSTQWAKSEPDQALPRGPVVSERFELARNFCNKLWNASRFALINLDGYAAAPVTDDQLAIEDRWILSRLSSVTQSVSECLDEYRYADAARALYDFAWDEFCSFFVEMVKQRLQDDSQRPVAQRVLAHTLDTLLRLLHPIVPFITEEVWQLLGQVAAERGLADPQPAAESVMVAAWPAVDAGRQDRRIESQFAEFQAALGALREIRSRQSIAPKLPIEFAVRCEDDTAELLAPMEPYFESLAKATAVGWGPDVSPPATSAHVALTGMDIYVDLKEFIDEDAERARLEKERERLALQKAAKEKKLANEDFVKRAPADVVQRERDSLAQITEKLAAVEKALKKLNSP